MVLEEISFLLSADVHRFMNDEAMVIFHFEILFYLWEDSNLNIARMSFFSNCNSLFLPISHCNIGEFSILRGILYHLYSFSLVLHRRGNFNFFACYMLLLFLFLFLNTQMINRALLANQRAIAKLFFNLMKSELKTELSHRLKWQDRVKDWKLIQKNRVVQSFRSEMIQFYFGLWITQSN